jgi:predicted Zn-dependent protease
VAIICVLLAALVLAILTGCDEDDVEKVLGSTTAASVEATYGVNRDPLLSVWLDDMGQQLVSFSTRQQIPYSFKILETDMVNAFAGPWGHIYVTEGLLDFAECEEEIAGVVGHEIGHVVNRDIIKSFKQSILFGIGTSVLSNESETWGTIAGIGLGLYSLRYSRKDEYGADDHGRLVTYRCGYNPIGEVDFFQRLMDEKEGHSPSYIEIMFRTHPPTKRRIDRQIQMPELDPKNPDALAKIGQGYMQRARYATALKYFQQAAIFAPDEQHIQVAMADALAACGRNEAATDKYQAILASRQSNKYAGQQLADVEGRPLVVVAALTAQEASAARNLQSDAHLLALSAGTAAVEAETFARQLHDRIKPVAAANTRIGDERAQLTESSGELAESAQSAVLDAHRALAKTSEVVYSVESTAPAVVATADDLKNTAEQMEAKLKKLAAGKGEAGQLAVIKRSMGEIRAAMDDLQQSQTQTRQLAGRADQIQQLAAQNVDAIRDLLSRDEDEDVSLLSMHLRGLASDTLREAKQATEACRNCRSPVRRAGLRTLIVQATLAGMAAGPAQRPALDLLVAYFMRADSKDVEQLRQDSGLGFGDAAYVMAVSTTNNRKPGKLLPGLPGRSLVDHLADYSDSSYGAQIMLKYLVHAMQEEVHTLSELDIS